MSHQKTFNSEYFENYLKKIRSELNSFKSKMMEESLRQWLYSLKERKLISSGDFHVSLKKLNSFHDSNKSMPVTKLIKDTPVFNNNFGQILIFVLLSLCILFNGYILYKLNSVSDLVQEESSGSRVLPFKGVIKETDGKPLATKRDAVFTLYNVPNGGVGLYSGSCVGENALEPSFNGSFTILIGSDCGMRPISDSVFRDNDTLYLGVTIGSEAELTPRYQIFTSTFSRDTEKLQGLPLGKIKSTVPFINENGYIEIESDSPTIKSINGEFSLEGKTLHLKSTQEQGNIIIDPALGSNVIITSGKLGVGTFTPTSSLDVSNSNLFNSVADFKNLVTEDDEKTSVLKLSLGTSIDGTDSHFLEFYAGVAENNPGTKVGGIRLNNEGVVYETSGADFAEYFELPPHEIVEVNHIMSLSEKGVHKSLPNEKIIGVVSDSAGFIGNNMYSNSNSVLIGLVGQVEVYISNIYGDIRIGDRIGATVVPGYGGKVSKERFSAGYVLESPDKTKLSSESCPASYRRLRDIYGKKIKCGIAKIIISLD